ncbi:ubiquitin carboxyl-terminal hydrolase 1-like isoform X2 [Anneissia japonica]|uniref:ubiquitin carboxyl-terminal hydrolase 1-like isoform X2 n=1 Tax=Anneissia japonica TaxID=1529436 RepID=UPI0014256EF0|nr:ubiquitin carboxyl-terminal hydrolase 1-like isoform X2 [Anneissia japonica]
MMKVSKLSLKGKLSLKRGKSDGETNVKDSHEEIQHHEDNLQTSLMESIEPPPPYSGLQNLGNTCFFNSVVQALRYTPGFQEGIKKLAHLVRDLDELEVDENGDDDTPGVTTHMRFLGQLDKLFRSMQKVEEHYLEEFEMRSSLSVYPEYLLNILKKIKPMFEGFLQHDAQELLCCFLSIVQDGCHELESRLKDKSSNTESLTSRISLQADCSPKGRLLGGKKPVKNEPSSGSEHLPRPSSSSVTRKIQLGKGNGEFVSHAGENAERQVKKKTLGIRRFKRPANQTTISMFGVTPENSIAQNGVEAMDTVCNAAKKIKVEPDDNTSTLGSKTKRRKSNAKVKNEQAKENKHELEVRTEENKLETQGLNEMCDLEHTKASTSVMEVMDAPPSETVSMGNDASCPSASDTNHLRLVERLFQGLVVMRTRCSECENFNERTEDFQEVGLPVQKMSDGGASQSNDPDLTPANLSLSWALAEYTCTERLTDKNKYFCERCMHHSEAERSVLFHKLPSVLIFHLKRFSTIFSGFYPEGSVSKVNTHLATPLTLMLTPWCSTECEQRHQQYELYAIVMHSGVTSSSGHYVCYAQVPTYSLKPVGREDDEQPGTVKPNKSKWARFDDDMVEVLSEEDMLAILCPITTVSHTSTPYLLFYREVTT